MYWVSRLLQSLATWFEPKSSRRRGRIQYRPYGETLEVKTLQSQISLGARTAGPSLHESARPLLGSAQLQHLTAAEVTNLAGARATANRPGVLRMITPSNFGRADRSSAAAIAKPDGSGKLDPKDPGGVELVRTVPSEKLDPKDPGGVELVRTANSGKLDPKDPSGVELVRTVGSAKLDSKDSGSVELTWVDQAVVDRLGRTHDTPRSTGSF